MTRIALISDVHANDQALKAVKREARRADVDRYWMLGDAIGYGHNPVGVMEMLCDLNIEDGMWLAGNHDLGLVSMEYPEFGLTVTDKWGDARQPLVLHHKQLQPHELTERYIARLRDLSHYAHPRENVFAAHGSYRTDPAHGALMRYTKKKSMIEEDYMLNAARWRPLLDAGRAVLVIYGHSHIPCLWRRDPLPDPNVWSANDYWTELPLPMDEPLALDGPALYYLNPGSVGFPRDDHYPCPNFVLLDEQYGNYTVQFKMANHRYDSEETREAMRRAGIAESIYRNRLLKCRS